MADDDRLREAADAMSVIVHVARHQGMDNLLIGTRLYEAVANLMDALAREADEDRVGRYSYLFAHGLASVVLGDSKPPKCARCAAKYHELCEGDGCQCLCQIEVRNP